MKTSVWACRSQLTACGISRYKLFLLWNWEFYCAIFIGQFVAYTGILLQVTEKLDKWDALT